MTSFSAPWGDDAAPGMKQLLADQKQFAPEQTPSIYFSLAYAQGKVVEQILRKAIQSGDLTREGILAAKQNLGEVDLGGITPAVTYTAEGGPPSRRSLITEIDPSVPGFLKVDRVRPRQRRRRRDRHLGLNRQCVQGPGRPIGPSRHARRPLSRPSVGPPCSLSWREGSESDRVPPDLDQRLGSAAKPTARR